MKNQKSESSINFKTIKLLDYGEYKHSSCSFNNYNKKEIDKKNFLKLLKKTAAGIGFFVLETPLNLNSKLDIESEDIETEDIETDFLLKKIKLTYANNSLLHFLNATCGGRKVNQLEDLFGTKKNAKSYLAKWKKNNFNRTYLDVQFFKKTFKVILYPLNENKSKFIKNFWIVIHDETENRNLISKIRNQENHYRTLLEQASSMLLRISIDEQLLYFSKKLSSILGYTEEDFKNNLKSIYKLIHPEDVENFKRLRIGRIEKITSNISTEYRILNKNGEYQWLFQRQIPKLDKNGKIEYYDSIILDINEKKQLELNLLHSQRMEVVGQMASQIAHDFNNQLTTVLGQITLAMQSLSSNSEAHNRLLLAEKATLACGEMSKNLLSFGKNKVPKKNSVNIVELLEDTINLAKNIIPANIKFTQSINLNLNNVKGDKTEIQQVLMNLIVNSKDSIDGSGKINIQANKVMGSKDISKKIPDTIKDIEYIEIQLTDSGCGIPEDKLPFVFDPYFSTKDNSHSGLGLSSVYSIIKSHEGFIDIDSKEGTGTKVSTYLPACNQNNDLSLNDETKINLSKKLNILLADDEKMLLDMTKSALDSNYHNIMCAKNGKEALELYHTNKDIIDLVILDYTMPFLNGREVIEEIKLINPKLPIILSSGLNNFALEKTDNVEFLAKPYRISELYDAINRLII